MADVDFVTPIVFDFGNPIVIVSFVLFVGLLLYSMRVKKNDTNEQTEPEEPEEETEVDEEMEDDFDEEANTEAEFKAIKNMIEEVKVKSPSIGKFLELHYAELKNGDGIDNDDLRWFVEVGARIV